MKHKAIVLKTEGDTAEVSVLREEACAHCAGRVVCGTAKTVTVRVKNPICAVAGDTVIIERPSERVLGYSALVFLAPVVLAAVLYFSLSKINEPIGIAGAIFGFVLPYVVAAVIDRRGREKRLPVITETVVCDDKITECELSSK